jgi:thiosulfate/3-mercaptopyruvate sulfurtransferase
MLLPLVGTALVFAGSSVYPKADLLIEAADLRKAEAACIFDVRSKRQYEEGHVPGAVWLDAAAWHKAFNAEADATTWGKRLGEAGVDPQRTVVVYGGDDVRDAARVWWILRYWGLRDARLLNGGWPAWIQVGGEASREAVKAPAKIVTLTAQAERLATKGQLLTGLKSQPPRIIDTRSESEYCGRMKLAKRGGSIPGAVHLEWTECLDPQTQKFKTPEELAQLFKERRIDLDRPAVTYCQSGGRAAVVAFALELMGGRQVQNYYSSWSEWGNAGDTPVQKVEPKKAQKNQ